MCCGVCLWTCFQRRIAWRVSRQLRGQALPGVWAALPNRLGPRWNETAVEEGSLCMCMALDEQAWIVLLLCYLCPSESRFLGLWAWICTSKLFKKLPGLQPWTEHLWSILTASLVYFVLGFPASGTELSLTYQAFLLTSSHCKMLQPLIIRDSSINPLLYLYIVHWFCSSGDPGLIRLL